MSILLEKRNHVAVMTMHNPSARNALTREMRIEMEKAVLEVRDDESIRALLITGSEGAFCAGGDINTFARTGAIEMRDRLRQQHRVTLALYGLEKPVLMAVNGAAYGVGFNIALLGDIILASTQARFCQSYSKVGIIPDGGGLYLLSRVVGLQRAKEMILLADVLDAHRARELGIVRAVYEPEQLMDKAMEMAERLAAGPTRAFGLDKALMARGLSMSMEEFLELEASAEAVIMESEDHANAVEAFKERREPTFKGK